MAGNQNRENEDIGGGRSLVADKSRRKSLLRAVTSPIALSAVATYVVVVAIVAVVSIRQARRSAEERLHSAAEDMVGEIDNCVDKQLAFIGRSLCEQYGSPEEMAKTDVTAMMRTYFLDEINVVNAKGLCIASTVPAICGQDQWSLHNPAKFCKALIDDGQGVYSQPFRQSATESNVYRKYVGVAFEPPAKGYVQLGFERSRLRESIDYMLHDVAHGWHIGESGFYVISRTEDGVILSSRREEMDGRSVADVGFDVFQARKVQNVEERDPQSREFLGFRKINYFLSSFNGEECLCTSGVVNQFHRYTAAIPLSEIYGYSRRVVAVAAVLFLVVLALVVWFLTRLMGLVARLRGFISAEHERQLRDLTLAKTIQESSLPLTFPEDCGLAFAATMEPAREVGGDFYDVWTLPSGKVVFLIADVSGKGVPAAMFMMKARAIARAEIFRHADFAEAVADTNSRLAENNDANMFVTAWFALYDPATGKVTYVNAGHNPPIVRRANGAVEWIRGHRGLVLAAKGGVKYRAGEIELGPGDTIVLYTDGVTEAMNVAGQLYGEERLEKLIGRGDADIIEALNRDIDRFVGKAEQSDDITILTARREARA